MKKPAIRLHIEELVLHSFAPNDRYAIADAVERELARLLTADFAAPERPALLSGESERHQVDAGDFRVTSGAKANSIGAEIAQAVYGGLTR